MSNTNLKPCSFCGGEVRINTMDGFSFIECKAPTTCSGTGLITAITGDIQKGIDQWNTRASGWVSVDDVISKIDEEITNLKKPYEGQSHFEKAGAGYAYTSEKINGLMIAREIIKSQPPK